LIRVIVPRAKGTTPIQKGHPCRKEVKRGQYPPPIGTERKSKTISERGRSRRCRLARPPWGPAYGVRCGYGSRYTTAHGRTLCRLISRCPNQGRCSLTQSASVATRHRRGGSATRAAARRGCAYDFLSPDILRSEGMGRSKGSRLKGWIENPNALRWRLDYYYAAPLPRQSREK
jgi:hypothetical protein